MKPSRTQSRGRSRRSGPCVRCEHEAAGRLAKQREQEVRLPAAANHRGSARMMGMRSRYLLAAVEHGGLELPRLRRRDKHAVLVAVGR